MIWESILKIEIQDIEPENNPLSDDFIPPKIPEYKVVEIEKYLKNIVTNNINNIVNGYPKVLKYIKVTQRYVEEIALTYNSANGLLVELSPLILQLEPDKILNLLTQHKIEKEKRRVNVSDIEILSEQLEEMLELINNYLFELEMDRENTQNRMSISEKFVDTLDQLIYNMDSVELKDMEGIGNLTWPDIAYEMGIDIRDTGDEEIKLLKEIILQRTAELQAETSLKDMSLVQEIIYDKWYAESMDYGMEDEDEGMIYGDMLPEDYAEEITERELRERRNRG
tara:strand:- start:389 stop:1234 length:846 start_codon:yes stop_codon:yes gene_type:complete